MCLGVLVRVTLVDEYPQEIDQIISNFIINIYILIIRKNEKKSYLISCQ